jgi:hypothetical protein
VDFGKLGQGFASVDDLEEIDIVDGKVKWATYISARLSGSHKQQLGELFNEFLVCFAWNYTTALDLQVLGPGNHRTAAPTWNFLA